MILNKKKVNWPNFLYDSETGVSFLNLNPMYSGFDCLISQISINLGYPISIMKCLLSTVFFSFLFLSGICLLIIGKLILNKKISFKKNFMITEMALLKILLQPMIKQYFSFFDCVKIENKSYLKLETNIICWKDKHLTSIFVLIIPCFFILIFLPLLLILIFLIKNNKKLRNQEIKAQVWLFTHGYKEEFYYWEYIILIKKILIILTIGFLNEKPLISIFIVLLIIFICSSIQIIVLFFF